MVSPLATPPTSTYHSHGGLNVLENGKAIERFADSSERETLFALGPNSWTPFQSSGYFDSVSSAVPYSLFYGLSGGSQFLSGYESGTRGGQSGTNAVVWSSAGAATTLSMLVQGTAPAPGATRYSVAYDVTPDGAYATGTSYKYVNGIFNGEVPVRWHNGVPTQLAGSGHPLIVSNDGKTVIGEYGAYDATYGNWYYRVVRWDQNGNQTIFPIIDRGSDGYAQASPRDVSSNGSIVAGWAYRYVGGVERGTHAVRWTGVSHEFVGPRSVSSSGYMSEYAEFCSADGSVVVGRYQDYSSNGQRVFRWDASTADPTQRSARLGTLHWNGSQYVGHAYPYDMSRDGRTIVGYAATNQQGGQACVWRDGQTRSLWDLLKNEYGVDLTGWTSFSNIQACTADGQTVVGDGTYNGASRRFVAYIPLNQAPEISTQVASTVEVKVGTTFTGTFTGSDADDDPLTVSTAAPLPANASLSPVSGSVDPTPTNPFAVTLAFTPMPAQFGAEYPVTIQFDDGVTAPATKTVTLKVLPNAAPVVTAPATKTLECEGETTDATFTATVFDDNNQPLTVRWYVDGALVSGPSVVAASSTPTTVELNYTFDHDPVDLGHEATTHNVRVEATDGYNEGSALTDVTIDDTLAPFPSVAAPDIHATTDAGKAYATLAVLSPKPTVVDQCDGDPTLELVDKPENDRYPIGMTTVHWIATDAAGNTSDPIPQYVIVTDDEAPVFGANELGYTRPVDSGEIFATFAILEPVVTDNDEVVSLTSDAPANGEYPIGPTTVTWTAADASGNTETFEQIVEVVNQAPVADAGADVTLKWTSAAGAPVTLSGSYQDADGHTATYLWSAPGVVFDDPTSATPTGTFPPGTTTAILTVTDEGDAVGTDTVQVTVLPRYVVETRNVDAIDDCVAQMLAYCQALKAAHPTNAYATQALKYAELAVAAHAESKLVTYFNQNDLPGQKLLYKAKRYQQYKYCLYVAQYANYVAGGASAKAAATCAGQGGLLDYNTP